MPGKWNAELDRQLLLNVIEVTATKPPSWDEVTSSMGPGFTNESCRQRYQKLKKDHAKDANSATPKVTPTKASAVPKTPKATREPSKSTKAAAKKRKRAESSELSTHDSDSDDASAAVNDDSDVSPKKKVKAEPGNAKTETIKSEKETADGSVDVAQDSLYE